MAYTNMYGWARNHVTGRRRDMAEGDEGEAVVPTPEETGAIATAVATGVVKMVEDASESVEITDEERLDMEELVGALVEVAVAVEAGADPGMAGEIVAEFLETNPEIADAAGAIGAALLDEAEGGGGNEAPPPETQDEPPAES